MGIIYWLRTLILYRLLHLQTRGVRIALINTSGQILLIRHRLHRLWVFPGGGIKRNELPRVAAIRECNEEVGMDIGSSVTLFGTYKNTRDGKNDTVYLFVARVSDVDIRPPILNVEVGRAQWYDVKRLPEHISEPTKQRILEICTTIPVSDAW